MGELRTPVAASPATGPWLRYCLRFQFADLLLTSFTNK